MNKRICGWAVVMAALVASSAWGQCQGGGGASARGASLGMGSSVGSVGSIGSVGSAGSTVNPYAQALASVGALQQQLAMQRYQKAIKDQQNRAERLALRQYWANQRRQEKALEANSPGTLAAAKSSGSFASLDFSPGR